MLDGMGMMFAMGLFWVLVIVIVVLAVAALTKISAIALTEG